MLTQQQRRHFFERGWVVQEGVFDDACMDACRMGMDELVTTEPSNSQAVDMQTHFCLINHRQIFRDCLLHPTIIEDCRQLMGTELRHRFTWMIVKEPHPERHRGSQALMDSDKMGWHRDMRPKWGIFVDDEDSSLVNCILINISVRQPNSTRGRPASRLRRHALSQNLWRRFSRLSHPTSTHPRPTTARYHRPQNSTHRLRVGFWLAQSLLLCFQPRRRPISKSIPSFHPRAAKR